MQNEDQINLEKHEQVIKLQKNLKAYQEKLLQINKRNRSIQLKKIYLKHNFDLAILEDFKSGIVSKILTKALANTKSTLNILLDSVKGEEADETRGKLRKLLLNLRTIEDETGQQTNFIGWPFIKGHATDDFYIRGPLILFPISITQNRKAKGGGWEINFTGNKPILNGALVATIKKKAEVDIPEDIDEQFEAIIDDFTPQNKTHIEMEFLDTVTEWIKDVIPIDQTLNDFTNKPISELTSDKIEAMTPEKFHIRNHAIMGSFPQADNEIFKDYTKLLKISDSLDIGMMGDLLDIHDPEHIEADSDFEQIELDKTDSIKLNTILPSDASQDRVILESKRSELVVIRGPPGTGKSQVITNLICDALTNEKKILIVCQKRAALDVVYRRLAKIGLDSFCTILDKENSDRAKMYEQLYNIILDERPKIPAYENISEISNKIDKKIRHLSALGQALHKQYFQGITAQKLYTRLDRNYSPVLDLQSIDFNLSYKDLEEFIENIKNIEDEFKKFENESYIWSGRKDFSQYSYAKKSQIKKDIELLISHMESSKIMLTHDTQIILVKNLNEYANSNGFLKGIKRRESAKIIKEILNTDKISEAFVSEQLKKAQVGITFWEKYDEFLKLFSIKTQKEMQLIVTNTEKLTERLTGLGEALVDFDALQEFDKKKKAHQDIFLILLECAKKMPHNTPWAEKIKQEIMVFWLDAIEQENPILLGKPFSEYDNHRVELAKLLEKKEQMVTRKIQHDIANTVTIPMISHSTDPEIHKWKQLSAELKKKRKVKPIRKLFEDYGDNLLTLSPCWLTSPEAVSKIFPLKRNLFDLVIVDEASQLAIERALPFLYRARTVVISGDEKQLQPFDLFQINEDEIDDEDVLDEKSLLDVARVNHEPLQLNWHYRSKYQNLIDFSNHAFYGGQLQVAPNVKIDPQEPPIRYIRCDGTWNKNQNVDEATRILHVVKSLWQMSYMNNNFPSIAIVTFNEQQQELIGEMHERQKDKDGEYFGLFNHFEEKNKNEKFVIKNIENIQGDERDIVIFSIGYAKDVEGKFANRFGTLSQKGGENRLNVAITRARELMVVVCSIDPRDIKETSKNPGPRRLRQFLEYAKAVNDLSPKAQEEVLDRINDTMSVPENTGLEFDSEFEIQVYEKLKSKGFQVDTQIGQSGYKIDLAIKHPDDESRYILAVECDGASFHSAKSAKERDVMRQKFLEHKGWTILRIWSKNWWRNPELEIEKITRKIDELKSK